MNAPFFPLFLPLNSNVTIYKMKKKKKKKKNRTKNESKSNWWAASDILLAVSFIAASQKVIYRTRSLSRLRDSFACPCVFAAGTRTTNWDRQHAVDLYTKVLHDFVYYPMDTRRSRYKLIFFLSVTKENNERPSNKWNGRNKKCFNYWYTDQIASLIFAKSVSDSSDLAELRDSVSKLWKALRELESEVRESFDLHAVIENHEHQVKLQNCF